MIQRAQRRVIGTFAVAALAALGLRRTNNPSLSHRDPDFACPALSALPVPDAIDAFDPPAFGNKHLANTPLAVAAIPSRQLKMSTSRVGHRRIEFEGRAFTGMVTSAKWRATKGVPKTAGAAAGRLSARLSIIAVLGTLGTALLSEMPASTRTSVPIEILRTKPAPIILHEPPAERSIN